MLTKRIVPCLDVKDGVVVKGVKFRNHEFVGEILELTQRYREQGADELVFYDITASADGTRVTKAWVKSVAKYLDIPFAVAGGIRTLQDAEEILNAGADKISINSPALDRPDFITELAKRFGTQCVVVGVDSRREESGFWVYKYTGVETKTRSAQKSMTHWVRECQERGAGEIVLNCMDADGTGQGFDIEQLQAARKVLQIPLVASGGAKNANHFLEVFKEAHVEAALAAGVFHRGELKVSDLKATLAAEGLPIRL